MISETGIELPADPGRRITSLAALPEGDLATVLRQVRPTMLRPLTVTSGASRVRLQLKLESMNPGGSSKDRTARSLLAAAADRGDVVPGRTLVESTSGNLGVSLALLARASGMRLYAIVDPRASAANVESMQKLGATVECVTSTDSEGNYLTARRSRVCELVASQPSLLWLDQYRHPANPAAHCAETAAEVFDQVPEQPDAIAVPVSTGGTLAGISAFIRSGLLRTQILAVDVEGSAALGAPRGPRVLTGIGSAVPSPFVGEGTYDHRCIVSGADAVAACLWIARCTGIQVGGSSGAAIAAALAHCGHGHAADVVCVCPDGGDRYQDTIYSERWRVWHGLEPTGPPSRQLSIGGRRWSVESPVGASA